jgi:hypothetical protein
MASRQAGRCGPGGLDTCFCFPSLESTGKEAFPAREKHGKYQSQSHGDLREYRQSPGGLVSLVAVQFRGTSPAKPDAVPGDFGPGARCKMPSLEKVWFRGT